MKKLLLLLLLVPQLLLADAVIFSGNDVKALKPNLDLFGVAKILTTATVPSSGAGLVAPKGSLALYSVTGATYTKTGAGNTAWTKNQLGPVNLTTDVTGTLPIANGGTGNTSGTATINANLTGMVTSVGNAASLGSFSSSNLLTALTDETGTGTAVFSVSPVLTGTPAIAAATGSSLSVTGQLTSTVATGTAPLAVSSTTKVTNLYADRAALADTVTTNANLTGAVTSVGNATSLGSFTSANLSGALTNETGSGLAVFDTSPTITSASLVTPALGTPASGVMTNVTGTASGLTAGNVTTNANLTGVITSVGNATSIASQTGTGTKFVVDTSPALVTPDIGVANGTSLVLGGTINANAVLDAQSTTKAFMPPRMTTTQKNAIASPTAGMVVYDSTLNVLSTYNGSLWMSATQSADTDWASYTPTLGAGWGTPSNVSFWWRRRGDSVEIKGYATIGTIGAFAGTFSLPNGITIDTAKIKTTALTQVFGRYNRIANNTGGGVYVVNQGGLVLYDGSTTTSLTLQGQQSTSQTAFLNNNLIATTGDSITISDVSIPISGWTTNTGSFSGITQVPGGGNIDILSVAFGTTNISTACTASPCFIDQIGTGVSSVTRASTGVYALNTVRTYTKLRCTAQTNGLSVYGTFACNSCSSISPINVTDSSFAFTDRFGVINCVGSY